MEGLNNSAAWLVPKESISLAMYASVGKVAILGIDAATSQAFYNMLFDDLDLRDFVYQRLKKASDNAEWHKLISTGTQQNLNAQKVKKFRIDFPKRREEQAKIGSFLEKLDNLITLHQRKLELLTQLKKAYLQKLFPRTGQKLPEIRFANFQGDWEQCKLGTVANYRRGSFPQPYGKSEWYGGVGAMPFVQVADVSKDMKLVRETKQTISKLAQPMSIFANKNSVLVTLQGSIGRVAITQYEAFIDRTVLIFESYKEKIDSVFWAYIINQKFAEEAKMAPGGTIKTITKEALSDFDLILPEYMEQKKIGDYLQRLDNLITLHQQKLNAVGSMKKSWLSKLFV